MTTNRAQLSKSGVTLVTSCLIALSATGCPDAGSDPTTDPAAPVESLSGVKRSDGARRIEIPTSGSFQNPAWSPDGSRLLLTRFRAGYNRGPADLLLFDLRDGSLVSLQDDGSENVNLPGSVWDALTDAVVFSSSRGPHDEIYRISPSRPDSVTQVTSREDAQAFEPSFSPDGRYVVFESHPVDVEDQGQITVSRSDGSEPPRSITKFGDDCRQPNWSPTDQRIVYQKFADGQWDLWLTDPNGSDHARLTTGRGDKTDASFSPDGRWIVYSSDEHGADTANLFIISVAGGESVQVTFFDGYDGAPAWSPDGTRIAFEAYGGDADGGPGTNIWVVQVPVDFAL